MIALKYDIMETILNMDPQWSGWIHVLSRSLSDYLNSSDQMQKTDIDTVILEIQNIGLAFQWFLAPEIVSCNALFLLFTFFETNNDHIVVVIFIVHRLFIKLTIKAVNDALLSLFSREFTGAHVRHFSCISYNIFERNQPVPLN